MAWSLADCRQARHGVDAGARSGRLTSLHGARSAEAGLQWADEVQAQLDQDGLE
jgi:hypothetical protein